MADLCYILVNVSTCDSYKSINPPQKKMFLLAIPRTKTTTTTLIPRTKTTTTTRWCLSIGSTKVCGLTSTESHRQGMPAQCFPTSGVMCRVAGWCSFQGDSCTRARCSQWGHAIRANRLAQSYIVVVVHIVLVIVELGMASIEALTNYNLAI